ncbi:YaaR family protein [Oceanobacillus damuensis]|uniref:YaaR family protein n=1 Tax=Oceanobacillus damuensis TaxID=937928 RepID=UPI0008376338|nr:YaaR family protein [Oceanobacillus damuensis]
MKITNEIQTKTEPKYTRPANTDNQSFNRMVQSHTQSLKQQELQQLIQNITVQGNKLSRYRSFRELAKFKRMVKDFLQETVNNGYSMQNSHSFGLNGNRNLTIFKQVDEKLIELTEEIMNQEKKTVDILGIIGEIKGLLINIYT